MIPSDQHEEDKVQRALDLIRQNPEMKIADAARQTRTVCYRVTRRLKGIPRSSSWRGYNKKLDEPESKVLKDYLLICYRISGGAGIENVIAAVNSILRY